MRLGLMPFTSDWAVIELFWRGESHLCSSFCRLEAQVSSNYLGESQPTDSGS